ncbi:MAG: HoxN/HupN/NixA family nickel/cobalt transporter, partial [Actinomycetota bacterium]
MTTLATKIPVHRRIRSSFSPKEWRRLNSMFGFIVFLHVVGCTLLVLAARHHFSVGGGKTIGVGTGVLAYT